MKMKRKGLSILSIATMTALTSIMTLTMSTPVLATTGDIINTGNKKIYSLTSPKSIQALVADLKDRGSDVFLKEDTDGTYYDPVARIKAQQTEITEILKSENITITDVAAIKAYIQVNAASVMDKVKAKIDAVPKQTVDTTTYTKVDSVIYIADNTDITSKFTDVNFKEAVYTLIGKTSPAPILYSDVKNITTLDVNFKNISSLIGIDYFTSLTTLYCLNNQLSTLDLKENKALNYLFCDNNQLTTLDVSKNTKLTTLSCYDNNLTNLDISKNISLTTLACSYNILRSLDISNNMALTYLKCDSNPLTSLDIKNNTELIWLNCYNNQLKAIDVSTNTKLTYLNCHSNELTTIDVSKNISLTSLDCSYNQLITLDVSKNTSLTNLDSSGNELITLNLSNNILLTDLFCNSNNLTTLDVSKNTALTSLNCSSNNLTTLDIGNNTALAWVTCLNNQITTLYSIKDTWDTNYYKTQYTDSTHTTTTDNLVITADNTDITNKFTDVNFKTEVYTLIGKASPDPILYSDVKNITMVSMNSKNIRDLSGIEYFISLNWLACYDNLLTTLDVSKNTALTLLDCDSNHLTTLDVSKNIALNYLSFYNNHLTTLDISKNTGLVTLWCFDNNLTTLDLSKNIGLSTLLCNNNQLTTLYTITNAWNSNYYKTQYTDSTHTTTNDNLVITLIPAQIQINIMAGTIVGTLYDVVNTTGYVKLDFSENSYIAFNVAGSF